MILPRIYPIHDQALTIEFAAAISVEANAKAISLHHRLQSAPFAGFIESVPAYGSLTVYFNEPANNTGVEALLRNLTATAAPEQLLGEVRQHLIPVCYDEAYGPDLKDVEAATGLDRSAIISLHTGMTFRVFMIGFVPGFAYMGILPTELETARKKIPRLEVPAGSVAIAGRQTGIYPAVIPGGWNIIGRTPWKLFDKHMETCSRLSAGDLVRFEPITSETFEQLSWASPS